MEEVHLWRGSAVQRALRSHAGKSGQFAYFNRQLDFPEWRGKSVLDFGGNAGYLLMNPDCLIRHGDYYCLDVIREAIENGHDNFPDAHWIHYNRYNCSFNPEGVARLPIPKVGRTFDVILAYSVFTHTGREELNDLVGQLEAQLAPGGTLVFTFIDPHFESRPETYKGNNLRWRLEKVRETNPAVDVEGLMEQSLGADWCALVNGSKLYVNGDGIWKDEAQTCMTYNVYYTAEFMQRELPRATILAPVNGDMQHCCVIQRES